MTDRSEQVNQTATRFPKVRWFGWAIAVLLLAAIITLVVARLLVTTSFVEEQLNAIVAGESNGFYEARIDNFSFSILRGSVDVENLRIRPRRDLAETAVEFASYLEITVPAIHIRGIRRLALIFRRTIGMTSLVFEEPGVHIVGRDLLDRRRDGLDDENGDPFMAITRQTPHISSGLIAIRDGSFSFSDGSPTSTRYFVEDLTIEFHRVEVDSAAAHDPERFLFSEDVRLSIPGLQHYFRDSLYVLETGAIELSSMESRAAFDSIRVNTTVTDEEFAAILTYRDDRIRLFASGLEIRNIDFRRLTREQIMVAEAFEIETLTLDVYSDLRVPKQPDPPPPTMPHESIQQLGFSLLLDSAVVRRADLSYSEVAADGSIPGTVSFLNTEASIYNIGNDAALSSEPGMAEVIARTDVFGQGLLEARITFDLLSDSFDMTYGGSLGIMEIPAFNQILEPLEGMRITDGVVDNIIFQADVNSGRASGSMIAVYDHLSINVGDRHDGDQNLRQRLESLIIGGLIRASNPADPDQDPVEGTIEFERPEDMSFFSFLWRTIRSGILSTIGLE